MGGDREHPASTMPWCSERYRSIRSVVKAIDTYSMASITNVGYSRFPVNDDMEIFRRRTTIARTFSGFHSFGYTHSHAASHSPCNTIPCKNIQGLLYSSYLWRTRQLLQSLHRSATIICHKLPGYFQSNLYFIGVFSTCPDAYTWCFVVLQ
jgi:hypothetical protein